MTTEKTGDFNAIKREFLELLLWKKALKIEGDPARFFTFKSGRKGPVFANIGALTDGESLAMLKKAYAAAAVEGLENGTIAEFDFVFGPAYKGIQLAALTVEGLYELHGRNASAMYDRKEEKAYGDVSADKLIVGAGAWKPGSGVLLVDDVITTGQAKMDALAKLKTLPGMKVAGMVIAVDRQELTGGVDDVGNESAVQALERAEGIKTCSIVTMKDIYSVLGDKLTEPEKKAIKEYAAKYGSEKM